MHGKAADYPQLPPLDPTVPLLQDAPPLPNRPLCFLGGVSPTPLPPPLIPCHLCPTHRLLQTRDLTSAPPEGRRRRRRWRQGCGRGGGSKSKDAQYIKPWWRRWPRRPRRCVQRQQREGNAASPANRWRCFVVTCEPRYDVRAGQEEVALLSHCFDGALATGSGEGVAEAVAVGPVAMAAAVVYRRHWKGSRPSSETAASGAGAPSRWTSRGFFLTLWFFCTYSTSGRSRSGCQPSGLGLLGAVSTSVVTRKTYTFNF